MSWRRVGFAFAVTFVCALVVFTLPRFVFNTVSGAMVQTPAQDTGDLAEAREQAVREADAVWGVGATFRAERGVSGGPRDIRNRTVQYGCRMHLTFRP